MTQINLTNLTHAGFIVEHVQNTIRYFKSENPLNIYLRPKEGNWYLEILDFRAPIIPPNNVRKYEMNLLKNEPVNSMEEIEKHISIALSKIK